MMLLALALFTQTADPLGAPELAKPVSITLRAVNTIAGLQALSKSAGVPMRADDSLAHEIIALRLDQAPLNGTMQRLADACGASWTVEQGTYTLRRTEADEQKRKELDHTRWLEYVKSIVAKSNEELAKLPPFDADRAAMIATTMKRAARVTGSGVAEDRLRTESYALQVELPFERFKRAVLAQIDPATLARAAPNRSTVFAVNNNEMEEPLPGDFSAALSTFQHEEALWASAVGVSDGSSAILADTWENIAYLSNSIANGSVKLEIDVGRLRSRGEGVSVQLVDPQGAILVRSGAYGRRSEARWATPVPGESQLTLTDDERAEVKCLWPSNIAGRKPGGPTPATVETRMRRPDQFEPLASYPSSLLFQCAEKRHWNLVADVPDSAVWVGRELAGVEGTTSVSILDEVIDIDPDLVRFGDGWLEVRGGALPATEMVSWRADRRRLTELMLQAGAFGFKVDPVARYAFETEHPEPDALSGIWLNREGVEADSSDWNCLRIEGALSNAPPGGDPSPIQARVGRCGSDVLRILTDAAFFGYPYLQVSQSESTGRSLRRSRFGYEPCDVYPHGLPPSAMLVATVESRSAAFAEGRDQEPLGYSMIAQATVAKRHPLARQYVDGGATTSERFRMGLSWSISMSLSVDNDASARLNAAGTYLAGGECVPFNDLPDFVKSVNDMAEQYDQFWAMQEKQQRTGGGGTTTNGPP